MLGYTPARRNACHDERPSTHTSDFEREEHLTWFRKLDDNFSGMAIRIQSGQVSRGSRYFMPINTAQSYAKQRFTACHELYHLLYQEQFTVSQNNAGLFNKKETEEYNADLFASYLLLPEMGLKELTPDKEQGRNKISLATLLKIEQNFGCSRSAIAHASEGFGMDFRRGICSLPKRCPKISR